MVLHHARWCFITQDDLPSHKLVLLGKDGRVALRQKCDARLSGDIAVIITAITAIFDLCIESRQSKACLASDHTQHFASMGRGVPGLAPALYSGGTNEVPPWEVLPVAPLVATCHQLTTQHKSCYFAFPDAAPAHSLAQDGHHQVTLGLT